MHSCGATSVVCLLSTMEKKARTTARFRLFSTTQDSTILDGSTDDTLSTHTGRLLHVYKKKKDHFSSHIMMKEWRGKDWEMFAMAPVCT
jgi:hypothetical protein